MKRLRNFAITSSRLCVSLAFTILTVGRGLSVRERVIARGTNFFGEPFERVIYRAPTGGIPMVKK